MIGASVGGVEALQRLVRGLPGDLPASVFVVLHLSPESPSLLSSVLERAGTLPASQPRDRERIRQSHIYVAPPDHHMMIERGRVRVVQEPKENRHRPAIDPLFRSAALAYGPQVVAVVLTGAQDDGTAGLVAVKRHHGIAMVQDPDDAYCPDMPQSALRYVQGVDHVLKLEEIANKIAEMTHETVSPGQGRNGNGDLADEVKVAEFDMKAITTDEHPGNPSPYACPECRGVLWEQEEGGLLRFRCRVGHAYTALALAAEQEMSLESALWAALRALEESASMSDRMAERAKERRHAHLAERFRGQASSKKEQARLLRDVLLESRKVIRPL